MQKKYLNLFFFLLIFYNTTIYLFPPIVLYFLGNNNIISDFTVLIYPILFLTLLTFLFITISKLRVLRLKSKLPFYFPIELGFLIWILISIILLASNNLTMSVVEKNKIPFLSIFKNFNSLGIIFSVLFSREYKKKTISFIYFIFYYIIILFFTILTLSKFLIILNLVIPFLIIFK